jgi:hypothetical protein
MFVDVRTVDQDQKFEGEWMSGGYRSLLPPIVSEIDTSSDVEDPNQKSMGRSHLSATSCALGIAMELL